jgi:myo-inositol-1(or 4)-monophosphatase
MKQTLIYALKEAGRILLEDFGGNIGFKIKESQSSIVTQADLKSDFLIVSLIRKRFPSHNIISEESGFIKCNSEFTWVIDPLDGTSNFASAVPWFGVLITLFENNAPIMGGAYLPVQDILYFAEKGKGATRNSIPLIMNKQTRLVNSLFAFSVDYTEDEALLLKCINIYKNILKASRSIRSTNSLVDFLNVTEGKFGGCINLFTKIWDISGLGLIIKEAGGAMKEINGNDIRFSFDNNCSQKNYAVMAGSNGILDELNKMVLTGLW